MADILARQRTIVGTTADWLAHNLVLGAGELALERLPDGTIKAKVGDGNSTFSASPYLNGGLDLATGDLRWVPQSQTFKIGGAAAANKWPRLSADGRLDASLVNLPATVKYKGTADPTLPPPAGAVAGDAYAAVPGGVVAAGWGAPVAGMTAEQGDYLVKTDSGAWSLIPSTVDLSGLVREVDLASVAGAEMVGAADGRTVQDWLNMLADPMFSVQRVEHIATAGQTVFPTVAPYIVGYVGTYLNGVRLSETEFTATNGADVVLDEGAAAGDVVLLESFIGANLAADAAGVAFVQTGAGAVPESTQTALRRIRYANQYGMLPGAAAAANTASLKLAIAATPEGGILVIPEGDYVLDASGGLANAPTIDKPMTLQIDGTLIGAGFAVQLNPCYLLRVTAANVLVTGHGTIRGDGTADSANAGDITTHPGLIYVTGNYFRFGEALTVEKPPKLGIALVNCQWATISGTWIGGPVGPAAGVGSAYFGIVATGGGAHVFENFRALADAAGGKFVNFIFTSGLYGAATYCTVRNGYANVWEKIAYTDGDGHQVYDNIGSGDKTDFIRFHGSYNRAWRNRCVGANGGVSCYDGTDNEISDNTFLNCKQTGIHVALLTPGYAGGFNRTKITGNVCFGDVASAQLANGITVLVDGATSSDIVIDDNQVSNFAVNAGDGMIRLRALGAFSVQRASIRGNRIASAAQSGIIADRVIDSVIANNYGVGTGLFFLVEIGGARNRWLNNTGKTIGSIGISGLAATSEGRGNKYTDAAVAGTAACTAAISTTIAHGGVAPNAKIWLSPLNTAFGVMIVSKGWPVAAVSGADFVVTSANGAAFAGTEQFNWRIEQ